MNFCPAPLSRIDNSFILNRVTVKPHFITYQERPIRYTSVNMNVDNLMAPLKSAPVAIALTLVVLIGIAMALSLQFRQRVMPAGAGETVTLTMWYLGGGSHHEKRFTDEMVRRYEQEHPGVEVL